MRKIHPSLRAIPVSFYMPLPHVAALEAEAAARGTSTSAVIRDALTGAGIVPEAIPTP
jgi:hypothetical protein